MTYKAVITDSAFSDLENIKAFIAKDNEDIAKKYISKIFARLEQLKTFHYSGVRIANPLFDYAKAYYLVCANHIAIYQVDEEAKATIVLRVLSHFQNWKDIVNKGILQNKDVLVEDDMLQIVRMNHSMCYDVYRNSQDENNRKYVPDEVFGSLEEVSEAIKQIVESYEREDGPFIFAVLRKEDGANIGYVQLMKTEEEWEIGYHIAEIFTGNGYATKAVQLFLGYLRNNSELKRLFGVSLSANKASRRVLEKCGFKSFYEGTGPYQGSKRKIIKMVKTL